MPVADQFARVLGRAPSEAETQYFQKFLDEKSIQDHEIGQILQASPEYQNTQLGKDTAAYGQKLAANDQQILEQGAGIAGAQATSRFAGLGRPNSSALAASVFGQTGQLAGNLAQSRQTALASFYGQGLQRNAALGVQGGQGAIERGYGLRDETRQRAYDVEDRNYMKTVYDEYQARQSRNQRNQAFGGLLGGGAGALIGAGGGALLGGPAGAMAGSRLGAGIGGGAGGLF